MKIKSLTIKGMHNAESVTYTFDKVTYLNGPNGSGKSTVLQAIQLALLGYIPGTNKSKSSIFAHANCDNLDVSLELLDNSGKTIYIERKWVNHNNVIDTSVSILPSTCNIDYIISELELPIYNFSEFVNMTSNKLKSWFISFLPTCQDEVNWQEMFLDSIPEHTEVTSNFIEDMINSIIELNDSSAIEQAQSLNHNAKEAISSVKGKINQIESTLKSLVRYDDETPDDIDELTVQISQLTSKLNVAQQTEATIRQNMKIQSEITALNLPYIDIKADPNVTNLLESLLHYRDIRNDIIKKKAELQSTIDSLKYQLNEISVSINASGKCPYTNNICNVPDVVAKLENSQSMIAELNEKIEKYELEYRSYTDKYESNNMKLAETEKLYQEYQTRYAKKVQLINCLSEAPECEDINIQAYQDKINEITDKIAKCKANEKFDDLFDKLTIEKFQLENNLKVLKIWEKLTGPNGIQTALTSRPFERLEHDISKYLRMMFSPEIKAKFHLSEKANSFSFGLISHQKYIPYDLLSSGEKCLYTLALMISLTHVSKSPLKLILIDDMLDHLDDARCAGILSTLNDIPDIQFILAGVKHLEDEYTNYII